MRNLPGDREEGLQPEPGLSLAVVALDSPWVKDSTSQANTVVWAVMVAGEANIIFPVPSKK